MKKNIKYIAILGLIILPSVSFAAFDNIKLLLTDFSGLINDSIKIIFGLALIFFFWGLTQFILHADAEKSRDEGKKKMIWGIVALFVFLSIYGIINFIGTLIGIRTSSSNDFPYTNSSCLPGTWDETDFNHPCNN